MKRSRPAVRWLGIIPFIAMLTPLFFNHAHPSLGGIPFFYWYQTLWLFLTALIVVIIYIVVYRPTEQDDK